jgi:hypothetical protein
MEGREKEAFMIIVKERRLEERLIPATRQEFDNLKAQIDAIPEIKKQLNTPLDELPQYRFLYTQASDFVGRFGLYDLLDYIANKEQKATVLFSKAGNEFLGFIAYIDDGKTISGIKMASFLNDEEKAALVMTRDLKKFLIDEIRTHDSITWSAYYKNTANTQYQKAIPLWFPKPKYNFNWARDADNTAWVYTLRKS